MVGRLGSHLALIIDIPDNSQNGGKGEMNRPKDFKRDREKLREQGEMALARKL